MSENVVHQRFGKLVVVAMTKRSGKTACICRCDCGGTKETRLHLLKTGVTKSCGCIASERISRANMKHSDCINGPSSEWITWHSMRQRCLSAKHKSYKDYGGRGITICTRWETFENFLADMGRKPSRQHSLDRIDNNGNYEPGNCRWATASQQAKNRRHRNRKRNGQFA